METIGIHDIETSITGLLELARELAVREFAPRAEATDQAGEPPRDNIRQLVDAGLMGLSTPREYGGAGAPPALMREYTEALARACGVTTFVQGQHQSAALLIAGGQNEELKRRLLPRIAAGETLCGVAFAHLRRIGDPILRAVPVGDCFILNGTAPWFTGWGIMHRAVIGATLPDGRLLFAVVPINETDGLTASEPMELCAMNASATVALHCSDVCIVPDMVMKIITRELMAQNDAGAILTVVPQPFGVASAAIDLMRRLSDQRNSSIIAAAADALDDELEALRSAANDWYDRADNYGFRENALRIRAWAIEHGVRASHAVLAASAGQGNALNHPAQRLCREALFYTLTAQTPDVQAATLDHLSARAREQPNAFGPRDNP